MKDVLSELSISNVETDFYDARRVADWVNEHPAVFVWVKKELGQPISGWKSYGAWAYHESDITAEYILDDKAKLTTPTGQIVPILDGINILRQALRQDKAVRLVGLSGVGKTRLVQALLDERIETEEPCLEKEFVIYADAAGELSPAPQAMLESILEKDSRYFIVLDNCDLKLHNRLNEAIIKRGHSNVALLTVEYDIEDDAPPATAHYQLESSSENVIRSVVSKRFKDIKDKDINRVVTLSEGNCRVALVLAENVQNCGECSHLSDNDLFERIFWQRTTSEHNSELLRVANYASVVYSFHIDNDYKDLAYLASINNENFYERLEELKRKKLLQHREQLHSILPHAIANRQAMTEVNKWSPEKLRNFSEHRNTSLVYSFLKRILFIANDSKIKNKLNIFLSGENSFECLNKLASFDENLVTNLVKNAPEALLICIEHASSKESFVNTINNVEESVWTNVLLRLAIDPNFSEHAMRILTSYHFSDLVSEADLLALAEDVTTNSIELLTKWISSGNERVVRIGLSRLEESLSIDFVSQFCTTNDEFVTWYQDLLKLMEDLYWDNIYKDKIKSLFIGCFSDLWQMQSLHESLKNSFLLFAENNVWLEGFAKIQDILYFRKKALNDEDIVSFQSLLTIVEPKTDFDQLTLLLCSERPFKASDISYQEQISQIKEIAMQWAVKPQWLTLLSCLLSAKANNVYHFGYGIACVYKDMEALLNTVKTTLLAEVSNPSLLFVHGLVSGWSDTHPEAVDTFLDRAMVDDFWTRHLISLQLTIKPFRVNTAYERLLRKAEETTDSHELMAFTGLSSGCRLHNYSIEQLLSLSKVIMDKPSGLSVVLDIWYMAAYCAKEKDSSYQAELKLSAQHLLEQLNWSAIDKHSNDGHHLLDVMDYACQNVSANEQVKETIRHFVDHMMVSDWTVISALANYLFYFMERFPQATLDHLYAQQTHENFKRVISTLTSGFVRQERSFNYDVEVIMSWCQGEHQKLMLIASMFRLFKIKGDTFVDEDSSLIEPVALALLGAASMHRDVLEKVFDSFSPNHWSGSRANIMENRVQLFDCVDLSSEPKLSSFWLEQRVLIAGSISQERNQEQERHRSESETFE
jgi:hypothetical protein